MGWEFRVQSLGFKVLLPHIHLVVVDSGFKGLGVRV